MSIENTSQAATKTYLQMRLLQALVVGVLGYCSVRFAYPQPKQLGSTVITVTPSCSVSIPVPPGWEAARGKLNYSPTGVIPIQGHFDPLGAAVYVVPFKKPTVGQLGPQSGDEWLMNSIRLDSNKTAVVKIVEKPWGLTEEVTYKNDGPFSAMSSRIVRRRLCGESLFIILSYYHNRTSANTWIPIADSIVGGMKEKAGGVGSTAGGAARRDHYSVIVPLWLVSVVSGVVMVRA